MEQLNGGYAVVLMIKGVGAVAFRDPYGIRYVLLLSIDPSIISIFQYFNLSFFTKYDDDDGDDSMPYVLVLSVSEPNATKTAVFWSLPLPRRVALWRA